MKQEYNIAQKIILLADDDSDDTEMFIEAAEIADKNVTCLTAVNGEELFKKMQVLDKKPEIIFLDMNMPIMNGLQCLKAIKTDERYKEVPVIMISTSSHKTEVETCLKNGALCYLVKPTNFNILIKVVKEVLHNIGAGMDDALDNLKKNGCILYTV
jgi:CheY-like chemotaxis protein